MKQNEIYEPDEDSFLLAEQVRKHAFGKVLDMGSGSGIQAENALGAKKILCVDINPVAVKLLKKKGFDALQSDLFENVKGKFDTIIFNPPYLPEDKYDKKPDTTGGPYGNETAERFLLQAKKHLKRKGIILLVVSSITPYFLELFKKYGYKACKISEKKLFFEVLYVYVLK
jgi:release factor glutamine methyltransferase